jgi:hypothetical protein
VAVNRDREGPPHQVLGLRNLAALFEVIRGPRVPGQSGAQVEQPLHRGRRLAGVAELSLGVGQDGIRVGVELVQRCGVERVGPGRPEVVPGIGQGALRDQRLVIASGRTMSERRTASSALR